MFKMKKILISVLTGAAVLSMLAGCGASQSSSQPQNQSPASAVLSSQSSEAPVPSSSEAPSAPESAPTTPAESASEASQPETSAPEKVPAEPTETAPVPEESEPAPEETEPTPAEPEGGKTLVVYFSASGNTRAVAETIADAAGAELYELVPTEPYTSDDLNWTNPDSRVNREHEDESHRTAISGTKDLGEYDTIFIGYPLWWRQAPSIVWNFVETSDLSGKTMIPFCTSTSDGIGSSGDTLAGMASGANWLEGARFGESLNEAAVIDWVNGLNLN